MHRNTVRFGFTLVELLVVIVVIGVLVGLLMPAVRSSGEAARRMSCSNNLREVGLGIHNYHSAYQQLPMQMGGTYAFGSNPNRGRQSFTNQYRLSVLVGLLPFVEQQSMWESIQAGGSPGHRGSRFAPMGPPPWTAEFVPWQSDIPLFRCPSDPGQGSPSLGRTNVALCLGDATDWLNTGATRWDETSRQWLTDRTDQVGVSGRGFFIPRQVMRFDDVLDGLSNTIMAGEIATDLADGDNRTAASYGNPWAVIHDAPQTCQSQIDPQRPRFWLSNAQGGPSSLGGDGQKRGARWADGAPIYSGFNTILPPNRESCLASADSSPTEPGIGMLSMSSRHQGGGHVVMGDGAVVFMTDSIESGDSDQGTVIYDGSGPRAAGSPSPYGLWGALGTRAQNETIDEQLHQ
ncbi:DUF1559 domain-containing protein [Stieleria sp. TO1_6]|uniref:DUF1559 domain-containing protein n=1 Tax=Stieleria tagensis TaxID=2956795 RepID=UPI00209A805B|nr:DUF1559 domain-containing protein [Stieleria tagensis]MCO8121303.1 DUF1559 domain-containing protein [Stieleria tagensis]